jgi:calcium-dependent protein kinase
MQRAVKIIRRDMLSKHEFERIFIEVGILKQLDHPNIVKIYEVFEDPKRFYIVTELCKGGEVFDEILRRDHFSEKDAAGVVKQVLEAVSYCHGEKVVHRDLKPENLLFDEEGGDVIKVIDFGTS